MLLPEWQIAAQNRQTSVSQGFRDSDEQRHLRIAACPVGEDQSIARRRFWAMQKTLQRRINASIGESLVHAKRKSSLILQHALAAPGI